MAKIFKWGKMWSFTFCFSDSHYQKTFEDSQKCCIFYFLMQLISPVDSLTSLTSQQWPGLSSTLTLSLLLLLLHILNFTGLRCFNSQEIKIFKDFCTWDFRRDYALQAWLFVSRSLVNCSLLWKGNFGRSRAWVGCSIRRWPGPSSSRDCVHSGCWYCLKLSSWSVIM